MDAEARRLLAHFGSVLGSLWAADDRRLARVAKRRRDQSLAALTSYRAARRFPKNDRFRARTPFFVDRFGTPCAVGHLLIQSGHRAIVERIAATANHASIAALAYDEELGAWLGTQGITLAEAARIQPGYGPCFGGPGNAHYDELMCQAEQVSQRKTAVEGFCADAPVSLARRVIAVSATTARVLAAYPPEGPAGVGSVLDVDCPVPVGAEFLVRSDGANAGHWVPLPQRIACQMVYTPAADSKGGTYSLRDGGVLVDGAGGAQLVTSQHCGAEVDGIAYAPPGGGRAGLISIGVPLGDVGRVLTSNQCVSDVTAVVERHPEASNAAAGLFLEQARRINESAAAQARSARAAEAHPVIPRAPSPRPVPLDAATSSRAPRGMTLAPPPLAKPQPSR